MSHNEFILSEVAQIDVSHPPPSGKRHGRKLCWSHMRPPGEAGDRIGWLGGPDIASLQTKRRRIDRFEFIVLANH